MYETLISEINAVIRQNGVNAITGTVLNTALNNFLQNTGPGMRFCGLASTLTIPIQSEFPKFYLSFTPGSYTHFINHPPAFTSGMAILYDANGTNTWSMYVWRDNIAERERQFLVDSQIDNQSSDFNANDIFYIGEVTKSNSGSYFTIRKTDTNLSSDILLKTIVDNNQNLSGYINYFSTIGDNSNISIGVNWDAVETGTTELGLNTSIPQQSLFPTASQKSIEYRLATLEHALSLKNGSSVLEKPIYKCTGINFNIIDAGKGIHIHAQHATNEPPGYSLDYGFNSGKPIFIKNYNGEDITIELDKIVDYGFNFVGKIILPVLAACEANFIISGKNVDIFTPKTFNLQATKLYIFNIYGIASAVSSMSINNYTIFVTLEEYEADPQI